MSIPSKDNPSAKPAASERQGASEAALRLRRRAVNTWNRFSEESREAIQNTNTACVRLVQVSRQLNSHVMSPGSTNRGVNKLQTPCGLDTLTLAAVGAYDAAVKETLFEWFETVKAENPHEVNEVFLPDGTLAQLLPHGEGTGFSRRPHILQVEGIRVELFDIYDSSDHGQTRPVIKLHIPGKPLLARGLPQVLLDVHRILIALGVVVVSRLMVTRADIFVDLPGEPLRKFEKLLSPSGDSKAFVCRHQRLSTEGTSQGRETLYLGKGGKISARIYDKKKELARDDEKQSLYMQRFHKKQTQPADDLTRVEFQLRRQPLKDRFGVDTVYDLLGRLGFICDYLTSKWLRLLKRSADSGNAHRESVHPLWEMVQNALRKMSQLIPNWAPIVAPEVANPSTLIKSAFGSLITAAANLPAESIPETFEEFVSFVSELLPAFQAEYQDRLRDKVAAVNSKRFRKRLLSWHQSGQPSAIYEGE